MRIVDCHTGGWPGTWCRVTEPKQGEDSVGVWGRGSMGNWSNIPKIMTNQVSHWREKEIITMKRENQNEPCGNRLQAEILECMDRKIFKCKYVCVCIWVYR